MAKSTSPKRTRGGNGGYALKKRLSKYVPIQREHTIPAAAVKLFKVKGGKV